MSYRLLIKLLVGILALSPLPVQAMQADLVLQSLLVYKQSGSEPAICVEGAVKNISGRSLKFIHPTADLYTSQGKYIDSELTTLNSAKVLMNNQTGKFSLFAYVNSLTGVIKLRFVDTKMDDRDMSFSANGFRTSLAVPITQVSKRNCGDG